MNLLKTKRNIILHNQSENTFKLFENVAFFNHSAYQSLFNGSIIRNSHIKTMDFARCDFEGSIFEKTEIIDTNFFHTYFQTSICNIARFYKCSFDTSKINNASFKQCTFLNCSFESAVLSKCEFVDCTFKSCKFVGANITLCKFYNCVFSNIKFGNCSFYQQIMINNKYEEVSINLDSLGQVFGISMQNILEFNYIFLGEEYGQALPDILDKLPKIYNSRKWYFSKIIYEYNTNKIDAYNLIKELNLELIRKIENGEIIKQTEIDFIINIMNELKISFKLPLFSLYLSILEVQNAVEEYNDSYYSEILAFVKYYIAIMVNLIKEMISEFYEKNSYITYWTENQEILFTIHYLGESNIEIYKMIDQVCNTFGDFKVKLIEQRTGSIIEILLTTAAAIFIFQLCLYGINGCLIQITDMKSKINILKRKNLPQEYVKQSILGKQKQPELLKIILDKLDNDAILNLISIFSKYNKVNIIDTTIEEIQDTEIS